jgi:hypothetical protein
LIDLGEIAWSMTITIKPQPTDLLVRKGISFGQFMQIRLNTKFSLHGGWRSRFSSFQV